MKEFIKVFEHIGYRHNWMNVFEDFLDICICVFAYGRDEDRYHEIIKRYSKEEQRIFPDLMAEMVMAYEKGSDQSGSWIDLLGDFYMEFGSRNGQQHLGQFFTPPAVCNVMAQLTVNGPISYGEKVNDCACGSGRTLLAAARMFPENRVNGFYVGQDLDSKVCKMAVINFVMYGLRGVIINMNTISMEIYNGYRIYLPETYMGVQRLSKAESMGYILQPKQIKKREPEIIEIKPEIKQKAIEQLTLQF